MIYPTKRGMIIGLGCAVWLGIASVNHAMFALILCWLCLGAVMVSFISALLAMYGFEVSRVGAANPVCGQLTSLTLRVVNGKFRRRQPLVVCERLPFAENVNSQHVLTPMGPGEIRFMERPVLPVRRGEYDLDEVTFVSGDPGGLFRRTRKYRLPQKVVVYPSLREVEGVELYRQEVYQSEYDSALGIAGQSQDFYGIREYHVTDGMRNIHWKSSVRHGRLMVKEFEKESEISVAILLDASRRLVDKGGANLEAAISGAASICDYCSREHCLMALAANGREPVVLQPASAEELRDRIMYHLALLKPGEEPLTAVACKLLPCLPKGTIVFPFALREQDTEYLNALDAVAASGMEITRV